MTHFVPSSMPAEGLGVLLLFRLVEEATPAFFSPDRPIAVARAPGRLLILGGRGGARAVTIPTAEAACAAVQRREDALVRVWSPTRADARTARISVALSDLGLPDAPMPYAEARAFFAADPKDRWAAHLFGGLLVLAREHGLGVGRGFDLLLYSDVPEGRGVGSSAAIEIAAMSAIGRAFGRELTPAELVAAAAVVEREVVGSGAVGRGAGHRTAVHGEAAEVLDLRGAGAPPADSHPVPAELEFVALDVGAAAAGFAGGEPIGEDERSARFCELLAGPIDADGKRELGALMLASHDALVAAGHTDPATAFVVRKARERMAAGAALYGASTAGRGTVVLLGEPTKVWHEALRLKKALFEHSGQAATIYRWSSPGAASFGAIELVPARG
ncbi:MAG: hypothetical protein U1E73_07330 [Planctomycetota bacterium]